MERRSDNRKNDFRRLKEEANIESVVDYIGLKKGKRVGSAQFVLCPNPNHADAHPTNAYYRKGWNTIYCTTCGKNMGAIDILMWTLGVEYGTAADILWELEGRPDWYYANQDKRQEDDSFYASPGELSMIGIMFSPSVSTPYRTSTFRQKVDPKNGYRYLFDGRKYRLVASIRTDWNSFVPEKVRKDLIRTKCKLRLREMDAIEQSLHAEHLFSGEREKIKALAARAGEVV